MKYLLLIAGSLLLNTVRAQTGIFTHQADIGQPKVHGSVSIDNATGTYTLKGGGYNIWFQRDEFFYAYNTMKGDFTLTANVQLEGQGSNAHRKIGWMVRASEDDDAAHISAVVHGDGLTVLQWRSVKGDSMRDPQQEIFAKQKNVQVIQLERKGKMFIMRVANAGEPLQEVGRTDKLNIPDSLLAGLILCSHDSTVLETGKAWNVKVRQAK